VPATARWARGATMPNQFSISRKTFERLEDWIKDNEASSEKAKQGMDTLVRLCVLVVKAEAQKRTMGPVAPARPALESGLGISRAGAADHRAVLCRLDSQARSVRRLDDLQRRARRILRGVRHRSACAASNLKLSVHRHAQVLAEHAHRRAVRGVHHGTP
jgi:hypothetical protein